MKHPSRIPRLISTSRTNIVEAPLHNAEPGYSAHHPRSSVTKADMAQERMPVGNDDDRHNDAGSSTFLLPAIVVERDVEEPKPDQESSAMNRYSALPPINNDANSTSIVSDANPRQITSDVKLRRMSTDTRQIQITTEFKPRQIQDNIPKISSDIRLRQISDSVPKISSDFRQRRPISFIVPNKPRARNLPVRPRLPPLHTQQHADEKPVTGYHEKANSTAWNIEKTRKKILEEREDKEARKRMRMETTERNRKEIQEIEEAERICKMQLHLHRLNVAERNKELIRQERKRKSEYLEDRRKRARDKINEQRRLWGNEPEDESVEKDRGRIF